MIMSQKNGSPLISNRRKSRLSLSVDPCISLENNDTDHNHGINETDLSREDNHTYVLARARHSVSNLNNKNGFSIDLLSGDSAKSTL